MIINRQAAVFSAVIIALMFAGGMWALLQLPEGARVPMHYGIDGTPDRWARSALVGLLFFPALSVALWLVFVVLPLLDPWRDNLRRSAAAYGVGWIAVTALMAAIQGFTIIRALGGEFNMARAVVMLLGVLFITIGNVLGKVRRNFSMGIRTRWTLADEEIWDKTHRFSGWVFVGGGFALIFVALTLVGDPAFVAVFLGVIAAVALLPVLKSYLLWRNRKAA